MDVVRNNNQNEFDNWSFFWLMTHATVQNNSILRTAIDDTMRQTISAYDFSVRSITFNELFCGHLIDQIFHMIFERNTTTTTVFCHDDVINTIGIVFRFFENFPRPNGWGRNHPQVLFVQTLWFQPSTVYSGTQFKYLMMTNTELNLSSIVLSNLKNLGLLPQEKIQEYHNDLDWRNFSNPSFPNIIRIAENILKGESDTYNRPHAIFTDAMSLQFQKNENTEHIKILLESVPGTSIQLLNQFGNSLKSIQFLQMLFKVGIEHSFVDAILSFFSRSVTDGSYSKSSYELCCERFDRVTINGLVAQLFNRETTEALRIQEHGTIIASAGRTVIAPLTRITEFYYCPDMIDFVLKNYPTLLISTTSIAHLSKRSVTDWCLYFDEEKLEVRLKGNLSLTRAREKNKLRGPIFVSSTSSIQLSIADAIGVRNGTVRTVIPENNQGQPLRLLKRKRVVERNDRMYSRPRLYDMSSRPRFCDVRGEGMMCNKCFQRAIYIMEHKVDPRLNDADIKSERKELVRLRNHHQKKEADCIRFLNQNVEIENDITYSSSDDSDDDSDDGQQWKQQHLDPFVVDLDDDDPLFISDRDSEQELRDILLLNYQKHIADWFLLLKDMHEIEKEL